MPSLATTPGKRLVMPRISRAGAAARAATAGSIVIPPAARSAAAVAGSGVAAAIELATGGVADGSSVGGGRVGGTSATGASSRTDGQRRINESGEVPKDLAARSRARGELGVGLLGRRPSTFGLIDPSARPAKVVSSRVLTSAGTSASLSWNGARPMPFVAALSVWKPGVNWSWAMRRSEFLTASTMFFVARREDALLDARQGLVLVGVDADGEDAVSPGTPPRGRRCRSGRRRRR